MKKAIAAARDRRLPFAPPWLRLLRQGSSELGEEADGGRLTVQPPAAASSAADASTVPAVDGDAQRLALAAFLAGKDRLRFPAPRPRVSVVIVLHNRAELTLRCLKSLQAATVPIELVIVDNASTDATPRLLARLEGATILHNPTNDGFLRAANTAARRARADTLLFLESDTIVESGSLEAALDTLASADTIGAVVGRHVQFDGRLQEAGSIVWRDGACQGYGRGDDPWAPPYMFRRNVDYGATAFLLTQRHIFNNLGGFDERYAPAYYEDVDFCLRLWQLGARVVYEPRALVRHAGFGRGSPAEAAARAQPHTAFLDRHREWLQEYAHPRSASILRARTRWTGGQRLLFIEDRVPHERLGAGSPRALALIRAALDLNHEVTLYPLLVPRESSDDAYAEVPRDVEILLGAGAAGLQPHLRQHAADYDTIVVSRPHNMRVFRAALAGVESLPAVIYDAEAIFALRDLQRAALAGLPADTERATATVEQELALVRGCDAVLTVSARERQLFADQGHRTVVVGHAIEPDPTPRPFGERRGFLFVGACIDREAPNTDAIRWFVSEVLPRLQRLLGDDAQLVVAGRNVERALGGLREAEGVECRGQVDDLRPLFDAARVFVAPTRYAAGLPAKAHKAAASGLPLVTTSLIAGQLEWRDNVDLLMADDADSFAQQCAALHRDELLWQSLRASALARIADECSPARFRADLERALVLAQSSRLGDAVTSGVAENSDATSR